MRGTVEKGKHKSSSEQSTSSSTTPATPAPVPTSASAVTDSSAHPGTYGYPQYPYGNPVRRATPSSVPTLPPASITSSSGSNAAPPVISNQPLTLAVDDAAADAKDAAPSKSITLTLRIFLIVISVFGSSS